MDRSFGLERNPTREEAFCLLSFIFLERISPILAHTQACQTHVIIGKGEAMIFLPQSQIFRLDLAPSATYLLSLWVASQEKDSH
jgi:hypothetical protein